MFGAQNHIATIANINNPKGRSDDKHIATSHEYIVFFAKNVNAFRTYGFLPGEEIIRRYNKKDKDGRLYREIDLRKTGDADLREDRPNLFYYFYFDEKANKLTLSREEKNSDLIKIIPLRADGKEGNWRWSLDTASANLDKLEAKYMPNRQIWGVMEKDYLDGRGRVKATSSWAFKDVNSERGSEEFISLGFDKRVFPKPKPLGTVMRLLDIICPESGDDIILDFFAGSGTTAHAVMAQNALDKGNRQFLLVQMAEDCPEDSDAYKQGFRNIAEISKERIRRAGKKIKEELGFLGQNLDIGFRVLKVDTSNMKDVYYNPDAVKKDDLFDHIENIKEDRTPEDLLFQVLLDWGVDLTLPIASESIEGKSVFFVDENSLVACFEKGVSESLVKKLAERKPLRVVFRDAGFENDSVKINVEQIFKLLSQGTEVRVI